MKSIKPIRVRESDHYDLKCLDTELLRTGIPKNNNSFFYSLFYFSLDFRNMNQDEKNEFILDQRQSIIDSISKENYFRECETILPQVMDSFRLILYRFDTILEDNEIQSHYKMDTQKLKILNELISKNVFDQEILQPLEERFNTDIHTIEDFEREFYIVVSDQVRREIESIEREIPITDHIHSEKKERIVTVLMNTYKALFPYVFENCFETFKDGFKSNDNWLNIDDVIFLLQNCNFPVNVFLVDANTGYPYQYEYDFDDKKDTILLLYFNDYHYEILGQKIKNKLCRNFDANQMVVQGLRKTVSDSMNKTEIELTS
ncbi:MAG: hypothetical protein CMM15_15105 [Rhodospirillaceae bacterium]|nr:hypothetical protein [Rhodospirillaceae bacterium]|tara:strand:- start:714 stop:1664 length:951 start_codon:yes stop_codon:yes gene_type:complete